MKNSLRIRDEIGEGAGNAGAEMHAVLAELNRVAESLARLGPGDGPNAVLRLIVRSAVELVPQASAAVFTYDRDEIVLDMISPMIAGAYPAHAVVDAAQSDGLGMRAASRRRRVLSWEVQDTAMASEEALACFPLVAGMRVVGMLYVAHTQPLTPLQLLLLDNFVAQAAIALDRARWRDAMQRDLQRKESELRRLRRAGLLISSRLGLQKTLEAILLMALDVTGAHYGIFRLVDERGRNLVTRATAGTHTDQLRVETLPIDSTSIMGWVAEHRQPLCIHDLAAAPWVRLYHPLYADIRMRSELAVPLIGFGGRLEGVLNLESPEIGTFGEEDSLLLQSLATQAVIAIQEARLLDALLDVAQRLLTQPRDQVLQHLATLARDLLNAAASAIWLREGEQVRCHVAGYAPAGQATLPCYLPGSLPLDESLVGQAVSTGELVMVQDVHGDARAHPTELSPALRERRGVIVPLLAAPGDEDEGLRAATELRTVGAFSVYAAESTVADRSASAWDVKVLTCLAHYAALAIHNAERQAALRTAQERQSVAEAFAAVGDIAANVLHHLNNKVGTIPVRIQGVQDKCQAALDADPYLATNLAEVEHSAREAMAAVRENLARLRPIHPAPVDVAGCVTEALSAVALPDTIEVVVRDLNALPPVLAGRRSLILVFTNLLENATDAMQGQGKITVGGTVNADWVDVRVHDDGPGIPPELRPRIFEFDTSGRRAERPSKLGFGLWWVKTLTMRFGGSVDLVPAQTGATFRVRLPRAEMEVQ